MVGNGKFKPFTVWNDIELRYRITAMLYLSSISFQTVYGSNFPFPIIVIDMENCLLFEFHPSMFIS